jgi:DNA repair protein RadC
MEEHTKHWVVKEIHAAKDEPAKKMSINQWDEDDRPREKMLKKGASAMSNTELLAILIGSGSAHESAVDLMRRLMYDCGDSLKILGQKSAEELMLYNGIGEAKAITLLAACELGKRRQEEDTRDKITLTDPDSIYQFMLPKMQDLKREESWILMMNNKYRLIGNPIRISQGGMTETAVDIRIIAKHAILNNATIIILIHNHPSGNPRPSGEDDRLTRHMKEVLKTLRIHLADHIIISDGSYYSYNLEGKL